GTRAHRATNPFGKEGGIDTMVDIEAPYACTDLRRGTPRRDGQRRAVCGVQCDRCSRRGLAFHGRDRPGKYPRMPLPERFFPPRLERNARERCRLRQLMLTPKSLPT